MTDLTTLPLTLALAQPGQSNQSIWVSLFPFAIMLLIFYLLVLMPMRRRQKKVQEFQASVKVGDKVILTSGVYGEVTKADGDPIQVQIADKVRVMVARASIGGYQGQEPVVQRDSAGGM